MKENKRQVIRTPLTDENREGWNYFISYLRGTFKGIEAVERGEISMKNIPSIGEFLDVIL